MLISKHCCELVFLQTAEHCTPLWTCSTWRFCSPWSQSARKCTTTCREPQIKDHPRGRTQLTPLLHYKGWPQSVLYLEVPLYRCIATIIMLSKVSQTIKRINFSPFLPHTHTFLQTLVWYSAGRDVKLFTNPLVFDPERWKRDETHAFAIQPFGFGPRACYGKIYPIGQRWIFNYLNQHFINLWCHSSLFCPLLQDKELLALSSMFLAC